MYPGVNPNIHGMPPALPLGYAIGAAGMQGIAQAMPGAAPPAPWQQLPPQMPQQQPQQPPPPGVPPPPNAAAPGQIPVPPQPGPCPSNPPGLTVAELEALVRQMADAHHGRISTLESELRHAYAYCSKIKHEVEEMKKKGGGGDNEHGFASKFLKHPAYKDLNTFTGKDWLDFSDKLKNIAASHNEGRQAVAWACGLNSPISDFELQSSPIDDVHNINEQLWDVFTHKLGGDAADFRRNTKEGMGLEVWRKLESYYHPRSEENAASINSMYLYVVRP